MTAATALDRQPMVAAQALALVPFINDLIEEGHVRVVEDRLVISEKVCRDHRFEWIVKQCRGAAQ